MLLWDLRQARGSWGFGIMLCLRIEFSRRKERPVAKINGQGKLRAALRMDTESDWRDWSSCAV